MLFLVVLQRRTIMGRTTALNENRTTRQRQGRYQHVVGSEDVLAGSPQPNDNEEVTEIPEQPLPCNNNDTTPLEDDAVQNESAPSDQADNDDDAISDTPSNEELFISIDDAIERLGMGNFQFIILIASGLCFAADAMQVILLSFLTLVLQQEWQLTNEETAFISSILFVGALVGTLILGPLADSKGRRPIFLLAASIIFVFAELVALCQTYEALLACMFFVGCGVGGLTVPFDLLAEFLPAAGRGTRLLLIEYFWTGGCLYVVAVAYFTLHQGYWRLFVALCAIPCLIAVMVGLCFVPESARWLVAQGRSEQAMDVLRKAAKMNGLDVELVFPPQLSLRQETEEKEANCTELFRPRWFAITLRLWGAWCAFAFGYYGTIMATTRVFESTVAVANSTSGNDTPDNQPNETAFFWEETAFMDNSRTLQQETKDRLPSFDYGAIFLSSAAELVGTTIVILAVDRAGRIPSQVLSYTFAGISVIALCFLAEAGAQRLTLIALGFCARVFEMAGTCVSVRKYNITEAKTCSLFF